MIDSAVETMLLSEAMLARDWDTPEEDDAWKSLNDDIELNSPNWLGESFEELRQRGFERINDPRRKKSIDLDHQDTN